MKIFRAVKQKALVIALISDFAPGKLVPEELSHGQVERTSHYTNIPNSLNKFTLCLHLAPQNGISQLASCITVDFSIECIPSTDGAVAPVLEKYLSCID